MPEKRSCADIFLRGTWRDRVVRRCVARPSAVGQVAASDR
jgi:hypothetical protein